MLKEGHSRKRRHIFNGNLIAPKATRDKTYDKQISYVSYIDFLVFGVSFHRDYTSCGVRVSFGTVQAVVQTILLGLREPFASFF